MKMKIKKMTAVEIRDLIDELIREHGKEKVIITIESILDFYKEKERD